MYLKLAQGVVPRVLLEDIQVMDMVHVPIVRVEDIPRQVLAAAPTVPQASIRIEQARQLHASHVLLEDMLPEAVEALALIVLLVDSL